MSTKSLARTTSISPARIISNEPMNSDDSPCSDQREAIITKISPVPRMAYRSDAANRSIVIGPLTIPCWSASRPAGVIPC